MITEKFIKKKQIKELAVGLQVPNFKTQKPNKETGKSLWIQGQHELHI